MEHNNNIEKSSKPNGLLPLFWTSKQAFIIALLWMLIILLLTGLPGNSFPKLSKWMDVFQPDKLIHIAMFLPFAWFWLIYFFKLEMPKRKSLMITFFFGIVYASLTEYLQHSVFIGRNANIPDAIADIIGVLIGVITFTIIQNKLILNKKL